MLIMASNKSASKTTEKPPPRTPHATRVEKWLAKWKVLYEKEKDVDKREEAVTEREVDVTRREAEFVVGLRKFNKRRKRFYRVRARFLRKFPNLKV